MKRYRLVFPVVVVVFAWFVFSPASAQAASWYVDNAVSTSGNGTSWATAWKQFSNINWASVNPGDTVFISGGSTSKTYTSTLSVGKDGTSSNRITIRVGQDAGHTGTVIFDGGAQIYMQNRSYITIDGSVAGVSKLKIQNIGSTDREDGWGIQASGSIGAIIRYVTMEHVNNGIYVVYGDLFEIDHNNITCRGDVCIRSYANTGSTFGRDSIHHNVLTSHSVLSYGGPDTIQPGNSTDIYNNTFNAVPDNEARAGQHPDTLQLGGRYTRVFNNTFNNVGDSNIDFDQVSVQDLYVYNNLFHIYQKIDDYPDWIRLYSTLGAMTTFSNVKIFNNTFIRDSGAGSAGWIMRAEDARGSTGNSGNEFRNNVGIISGSIALNAPATGSSWAMTFSNNVWNASQTNDPTATVGTASLDSNYVPTSGDTLARDRGTTLSYFSTDKLGTARPQGSAWDIGAYEYINTTPDTEPPVLPANFNLAATSPSQSSITVSWNPATDNVGVTGYIVERCQGSGCSTFTQVGTPSASPFVDSGLTANTFYNYHVRATDAAGNLSGWSNVVGATTQAPDTTPPSAPSNLSATASSSSTVNLTWTASTDNVAVTGYKVERCAGASCSNFTEVGTPTATSYSDTGLTATTTYRYQVHATDAANNNSGYSSIANATTPVAPPTPTFISEYETPWNSATSPKTTANFSVQTGDILVAYAVNESSSSTIATPPTGTLTGTWTLRQTISATSFTALRLWSMNVASNQTNVNVSFTNGGGNFGADVLHFRNASSVGITAQANSNTGNPTITLNGVSENSTIVMVNGDWSAQTGARTYNTTQAGAFTETSAYADGTSYGLEAGYYANAGASGNKNVGLTAPTGMTWALAALEVKGNPTAQPISCNTVTTANFSDAGYNSYGAPFDAFQTNTNLMDAKCTNADTHTINLTTGVTGDTTRIVYTKGYWYDAVTTAWRQYAGTCTGALNGEWCQGSVSATITDPNVSTASSTNPTYLVGMTCSVQGGSWRCGCRDTTCANFSWQIQGAGL